jgi:hypothetical protein
MATMRAKDVIAATADRLGGVEWLLTWAREDPANERAFWRSIYPKLIKGGMVSSADLERAGLSHSNVRVRVR